MAAIVRFPRRSQGVPWQKTEMNSGLQSERAISVDAHFVHIANPSRTDDAAAVLREYTENIQNQLRCASTTNKTTTTKQLPAIYGRDKPVSSSGLRCRFVASRRRIVDRKIASAFCCLQCAPHASRS